MRVLTYLGRHVQARAKQNTKQTTIKSLCVLVVVFVIIICTLNLFYCKGLLCEHFILVSCVLYPCARTHFCSTSTSDYHIVNGSFLNLFIFFLCVRCIRCQLNLLIPRIRYRKTNANSIIFFCCLLLTLTPLRNILQLYKCTSPHISSATFVKNTHLFSLISTKERANE